MTPLRTRVHEVIFEADTFSGKVFDLILLISIILSVAAVMLESIAEIRSVYWWELRTAEWVFTVLFTVEYFMRLWSVKEPAVYARSFFGIVDLLAIVPTYLSLFVPGAQALVVVRALRVLRLFRILKLLEYIRGANVLLIALWKSRAKITVFAISVLIIVTIVGSLMYLIEGEAHGFSNIPISVYWAIVTITTVGFGDITPETPLGKLLAAMLMLLGYAIIAVPTGIVTAEIFHALRDPISSNTQHCVQCGTTGHQDDAKFCRACGASLGLDGPNPEP